MKPQIRVFANPTFKWASEDCR